MKSTDHKQLKLAINQKLSTTLRQLHHEFTHNVMYSSTVQSDNDIAQQFTTALEAAFIHGLKDAYFDKHKRNKELPKPQFWNLICRISHKDTMLQIRKLSFIRSRVGKSRAWLRLTLNEGALPSYLSSLVQTSEYKALLTRYYETYALLRDSEECGIFLSRLQGIEALQFELGCNSPILNSWTPTPLELAGIIAVNPNKKSLLENGVSATVKSQTLTPASSFSQLHSSGSSYSRQGSLTNSIQILSSSPAFSVTSQMSGSLTSISKFAGTEISNMVEVDPEFGLSFGDNVDGNEKLVEPVLHSRHLARRKNKRRKRQLNEDVLSSSSRCSSMSSLNSTTSAAAGAPVQYESNLYRESRNNSTNSSDAVVQEPSNGKQIMALPAGKELLGNVADSIDNSKSVAIAANDKEQIFSNRKSGNQSITSFSLSLQHTRNFDASNDDCVDADTLKADNEDSYKSDTKTLASTQTVVANQKQSGLDTTFQSDEFIDVYAVPSQSPHSSVGLETIDETLTEAPVPVSPGYGNSLLCAAGWSSDVTPDPTSQTVLPSITSTPIVRPPSPSLDLDNSSTVQPPFPKSSTVYGRREGYLKKKGDLLFWRVRWFVLTAETLAYYKDRNDNEELDVFHLIDVEKIDETDINKNNSICIKMLNGDEHLLAADNRKLIQEWTNDIKQAVSDMRANPSAYSLDAVENTYEVLDALDAERDSKCVELPANTSWFGSMKSHMTKIANEKGLDAQNYQCADCASPIGMIYGLPRVCAFTGLYYCSYCHHNDEHLIPSRMIHNWDFRKHKVSKGSKKFLLEMWKEPCIDMSRVNPLAYRHIAELQKIHPLRVKLAALQPYVTTCRLIPVGSLQSKLRGHFYMLDDKPYVFSACDLDKLYNDNLYDVINKTVTFCINHVTSCQLCSSRGFNCEICGKDEIIFAFQTQSTTQCEDCKSVFHIECLPDLKKCPKCERRDRRLKQQSRSIDDDYDDGLVT